MDEEAEQQLTAQLSSSGGQQQQQQQQQQLDVMTSSSSPVSNQQQKRSLASLLSIKREPRRAKTPSVVVTDETTHLVGQILYLKMKIKSSLNNSLGAGNIVGIDVHSCDGPNQFEFQEQVE